MKRATDDVYGAPPPEDFGPLFDSPFSASRVAPTGVEKVIARIIWNHTRNKPVPITMLALHCGLNDRQVKGIVEDLRCTHRCAIGASRQEPSGYFWIRSAEDREAAVRPYREQILTMWRTLRSLDSPASLRELHGQLRLEAER